MNFQKKSIKGFIFSKIFKNFKNKIKKKRIIKKMKFFNLVIAFFIPFTLAYIDGPCSDGSGWCTNTSTCTSKGGSYVSNKCPNDPADVKCCRKSVTVNGQSGRCLATQSCSTSTLSGYCPGGNNVKLCLDGGGGNTSGAAVAREVYNFFTARGWTKNAICGMLGNMEYESAGLVPTRNEFGGGGGYGLLQWTPASKLQNWAAQNGLDYTKTNTQCLRVQYEFENKNVQYIATNACNLSFAAYSKSTQTPEYLAECFARNYERPNAQALQNSLATRKSYARKWFNNL